MALTDVDRVRQMLGETIPADGTDADTMFSRVQIEGFISGVGSLNKAALTGWRAKAGEYANLVNVSEGNSMREMSDLHRNALAMIEYYEKVVKNEDEDEMDGRRGHVIIGEISRSKRYH